MGLNKINRFLTGNSEPWAFKFKEVFSQAFKKHKKNNDDQNNELSAVPKPWIWLRVFLCLLLLSFIYYTIIYSGGVILAFPWFALVTASVIPISVAVFLYESNIKESVSLLNILIIFFVGTAFAFLSFMNVNVFIGNESIYAAFFAPVIEEIAKLTPIMITIVLFKYKKLSSAVLIGYIVGAGFQIAETLGYATYFGYEALFSSSNEIMPDATTLFIRSLAAFGSHGLWGAIEGAAFFLSQKQDNKKFNTKRFLAWMALSVVFHMLWNSNAVFIESNTIKTIVMIVLQLLMFGLFVFIMDACIKDNKPIIKNLIIEDSIVIDKTENDDAELVS